MNSNEILAALRTPFHPSHITWKPGSVAKNGERALAMAYGDMRAYQNRLDEVAGGKWDVSYAPWGDGRIICTVSVFADDGVMMRSSTGEMDNDSERNEIGGTVAEAQAFKRACAMFGLGRYLYTLPSVWADYDKEKRTFTEGAKAKLLGILMNHYRQHTAPAQQQAPLPEWDMAGLPEMDGHNLPGEQEQERVTEAGKPATAGSGSDLPGVIASMRKVQTAGAGGPMSEAQRKMLGGAWAKHWGTGSMDRMLPQVTGVPVGDTDKRLASQLIDSLSRDKKDQESGKYVPNDKYRQSTVDAISAYAGEGGQGT